jgi:hypothetical protein
MSRSIGLGGCLLFGLLVSEVGGFAPIPAVSPIRRVNRAWEAPSTSGKGRSTGIIPQGRQHCSSRCAIFRPTEAEEEFAEYEPLRSGRVVSLPNGLTVRPLSQAELCTDVGSRKLMQVTLSDSQQPKTKTKTRY